LVKSIGEQSKSALVSKNVEALGDILVMASCLDSVPKPLITYVLIRLWWLQVHFLHGVDAANRALQYVRAARSEDSCDRSFEMEIL